MRCESRHRHKPRLLFVMTDPECDWADVERQIDADTCDAHGRFCCPWCFDMGDDDDY